MHSRNGGSGGGGGGRGTVGARIFFSLLFCSQLYIIIIIIVIVIVIVIIIIVIIIIIEITSVTLSTRFYHGYIGAVVRLQGKVQRLGNSDRSPIDRASVELRPHPIARSEMHLRGRASTHGSTGCRIDSH